MSVISLSQCILLAVLVAILHCPCWALSPAVLGSGQAQATLISSNTGGGNLYDVKIPRVSKPDLHVLVKTLAIQANSPYFNNEVEMNKLLRRHVSEDYREYLFFCSEKLEQPVEFNISGDQSKPSTSADQASLQQSVQRKPAIVFEWAEPFGRWIRKLMAQQPDKTEGPLTVKSIISLASDIAQALRGMHKAGYVHGDVGSQSIFVLAQSPTVFATYLGNFWKAKPFMASESAALKLNDVQHFGGFLDKLIISHSRLDLKDLEELSTRCQGHSKLSFEDISEELAGLADWFESVAET